jgi:hypothetical protein
MLPLSGKPAFYMYTDAALDFGWMESCPNFLGVSEGTARERLGEVGLRQTLVSHAGRTMDPSLASLFYLPVWEAASFMIGPCNGTTHTQRMQAAHDVLARSEHFQRRGGADHFWLSTFSQPSSAETRQLGKLHGANYSNAATLAKRMHPLSRLLKKSIAGRHKTTGNTMRVGCLFEVPYRANIAATRTFDAQAGAAGLPPPRGIRVQFAGSIDVCCTGAKIRCAMSSLVPATYLRNDVQIVPSVRKEPGPCELEAAEKVQAAVGFRPTPLLVGNEVPSGNHESASRMAGQMLNSTLCLIPAGDTCVTSRLYTAIAVGCIPVVICDGLHGAFPHRAQYSQFWIKLSARDWVRDPRS